MIKFQSRLTCNFDLQIFLKPVTVENVENKGSEGTCHVSIKVVKQCFDMLSVTRLHHNFCISSTGHVAELTLKLMVETDSNSVNEQEFDTALKISSQQKR